MAEQNPQPTLNLAKDLFLTPIAFKDDPEELPAPDMELHFYPGANALNQQGSKIFLTAPIPEGYGPAKKESRHPAQIRLISNAQGDYFIPLFLSFESLHRICGSNVRIGVISLDDINPLLAPGKNDQIKGIVLGPGILDKILLRNGQENTK